MPLVFSQPLEADLFVCDGTHQMLTTHFNIQIHQRQHVPNICFMIVLEYLGGGGMVAVGATSEYFVTCTLCCQSHLSFPFLLLDVSKERWKLTVPTAAYGRRYVVRPFCFFVYGRRGVMLVVCESKKEFLFDPKCRSPTLPLC